MKTSPKGLAEITGHEGIVQMPYKDSVEVWTWGVGHTEYAGDPDPAKMTKGVARPMGEVMAQFIKDIAKYEADVNKAVTVPMEQHEFDALVSFHYNTGGIFRASLTKYLNAGKRASAANAFMNWTTPKSITARRRKEMNLFRSGTYGDGYATVYPAYASGRVQWSKGKRVRVLDYLGNAAPEQPEDKPLSHYQQLLTDLGFDPGPIDDKWGKRTKAAVAEFQRANGGLVVDGILGPLTSQAINQAYADRPGAVSAASLVSGGAAASAAVVAGFPWQVGLTLAVVAACIYAVWRFRDGIKERILTFMGL